MIFIPEFVVKFYVSYKMSVIIVDVPAEIRKRDLPKSCYAALSVNFGAVYGTSILHMMPLSAQCSLVNVFRLSTYLRPISPGFCMLVFGATAPQWARTSSFLNVFQITPNDASQSAGLFWTSDQLVAGTST